MANKITQEQKELLQQNLKNGEWSFDKVSIEASFKSNSGAILNIYSKSYAFQGTNQEELKNQVELILNGEQLECDSEDKEIFIVYGHENLLKNNCNLY